MSRRSDAGAVGLAAAVAAIAGYAVLWLAARALTPAANAEFLAFWGLLFFCFGTLAGLQSEVTRAVHDDRTSAVPGAAREPRTRVLAVGLAVGLALALLVVVTSPLWGHAVLGADATRLVVLVGVGALAFAGHATVAGSLAGLGEWRRHATLVGAESTTRLLLAAAVAVGTLVDPVAGLPAAAAAAAGTWLVASVVPSVGRTRRVTVPGSPGAVARHVGHAMTGTAASAALVVGFPVLLRVTTTPEAYALAAPLLLAVQLTRAPLMIPLGAFQGMAIAHFLDRRTEGVRPLLRVAAMIVGVGAVGAGLAALIGPWLMAVIFGADYRVGAGTLAGLTAAAAVLAVLTLTGAATLALGQHRGYALGWLVATVVCAGLLLTPLGLAGRAVLGLVVGPLAGVAAHAWTISQASAARR